MCLDNRYTWLQVENLHDIPIWDQIGEAIWDQPTDQVDQVDQVDQAIYNVVPQFVS